MQAVCEHLKAHIPDILEAWREITDEEPWSSLPESHRLDDLPNVTLRLFEAALCAPADRESHREKVNAAVAHGVQRRQRGFQEATLLAEYYMLREAIWRYAKRAFPLEVAGEAILRIDSAIMLATRATLIGFYQPEFEKQGRWPAPVDSLVTESPLLRLGNG